MSAEDVTSGRVVYTTKEILDGINDKLARANLLVEQHDRRLDVVEGRLDNHDKILAEQLPRLQKMLEELDVQKKVEAALDSRRLRGMSNRDRAIASVLAAAILVLALLQYLPHLTGG